MILATWTTRTGLISSVHAFGRNDVLIDILSTLLIGSGLLSAGLLAWRWRRFASGAPIESVVSREFLYYLTDLLLVLFAAAIAFATVVVPLLLDRTVGPETYDTFARPLGVVFLALIAALPAARVAQDRGRPSAPRADPAAGDGRALGAALAAARLPVRASWGFIGLVVCGFAFGAVLQFVVNAARRAAGPGKAWTAGLRRALLGSRTRSAAYLAHVGMVLIVAGLLGSTVYKTESTALVATKPGVGGRGARRPTTASTRWSSRGRAPSPVTQQSQRTYAAFDVFTDGGSTKIGTVEPHTDIYPGERRRRAAP